MRVIPVSLSTGSRAVHIPEDYMACNEIDISLDAQALLDGGDALPG
jgi:hypothetical protein